MHEGTQEIIDRCERLDVRLVKLQFTDILGSIKNVTIPITQLDKALAGDISFDGSSIEGFVRIDESDMLLRPDPDSFAVFPWNSATGMTRARLMCDVTWPDGADFEGCPRSTLKNVVEKAETMGFSPQAGPEPEFFLFLRGDDGSPTTKSHDQAGYFDLPPLDRGEEAREDMVQTLMEMGFEIEASHHEAAPAQHEIDFKYADALTIGDHIATFRFVVCTVALKHDLHATFMPKPQAGINGSGMHVHMSLFLDGENAFYDPDSADGLSDVCRHFIAGVMKHCRSFTAITNPLVNSYKRLVPGYEAPVHIAWSKGNRTPLIRIPARRGEGTRIELRSPDPACNPYLALAVMFRAGLDGIERELEPVPPVEENIYELDVEERRELGVDSLPGTLDMALDALEQDQLILETLGQHISDRFIQAKRIEWQKYRSQVHRWEMERYLGSY